jgi:ribosomal protein S18 acetylase RimI-like enzyme
VKAVIKEFPNANKVDLEVEKQNFKAQAFYKKLGFHNSGEKVFEVKNVTIECFVMEKDLN